MTNIKLNPKFLKGFLKETQLEDFLKKSVEAKKLLHNKEGAGSDFLGWVELPNQIQGKQIKELQETAEKIAGNSEYLVVVGIGGSYLGSRAIIEANSSSFDVVSSNKTKVLYAGHHIDPDYHNELLDFLEDKEFSINVISKSGTTTEPAIAFRTLMSLAKKKYGESNLKNRIYSTTDSKKGALKKLSDEFGLKTFVIPDDIGGRFSVLTPVGLLPIAAAGIDIQKLVDGARTMASYLKNENDPYANTSCLYAAYRNFFYSVGHKLEILVNYNPKMHYFTEWWKQLYGESEGKGKKGIFPAGVDLTTDLHSLGQYIQDGERIIFETVLSIVSPMKNLLIEEVQGDPDGLNFLAGKTLSYITNQAMKGTMLAHFEGGVPCIELQVPQINSEICGELIYFFEYACGISGYLLGVNPFDQPGVEDYKNNMFALLGKKGYESKKIEVENKLKQLD
ncbi:MAG: glucose-6-phosphate isomerase [Leptospiraceae bacterium]|nr:glucose-6-phosphate isomerase [Leptospiraceae bacterium]MCP5495416.1 glucose-6-phosphate isomerase [Leptospiraceae bacterium]